MVSSISYSIVLSMTLLQNSTLWVGSIWQCSPRIRFAIVWSEARISQKTSLPQELNSHLYCAHAAKLLQVSGTMVKARWESGNLMSHARIRKSIIHLSWWCKNRQVLEKDNMGQQILSVLSQDRFLIPNKVISFVTTWYDLQQKWVRCKHMWTRYSSHGTWTRISYACRNIAPDSPYGHTKNAIWSSYFRK